MAFQEVPEIKNLEVPARISKGSLMINGRQQALFIGSDMKSNGNNSIFVPVSQFGEVEKSEHMGMSLEEESDGQFLLDQSKEMEDHEGQGTIFDE